MRSIIKFLAKFQVMNTIDIKGSVRTSTGKKATKAVRNSGSIPCVLYGVKELTHFTTTESEVKNLVYTGDFKVANINVDGKVTKAILKDIQYHPVKDTIVHIDFLQLTDGHPVKLDIPLVTKGSSPGVKVGGKLIQSVRKVKVKTIPEKIVSELTVDISSLDLGQSLRVRDIENAEGIEILQNPSIPVVSIEIPRALRSAAANADK